MNNWQQFRNSPSNQVQGGITQTTINNEATVISHFRVKHTSGETFCATIDEARTVLQNKPGAKIFRDGQG